MNDNDAFAPVTVPNLVGLEVRDARDLCVPIALVPVSARQDSEPLAALTWPGYYIVTAQRPEPGTTVARGEIIQIDFAPEQGDEPAADRLQDGPSPDSLIVHTVPDRTAPPGPDAPTSVENSGTHVGRNDARP